MPDSRRRACQLRVAAASGSTCSSRAPRRAFPGPGLPARGLARQRRPAVQPAGRLPRATVARASRYRINLSVAERHCADLRFTARTRAASTTRPRAAAPCSGVRAVHARRRRGRALQPPRAGARAAARGRAAATTCRSAPRRRRRHGARASSSPTSRACAGSSTAPRDRRRRPLPLRRDAAQRAAPHSSRGRRRRPAAAAQRPPARASPAAPPPTRSSAGCGRGRYYAAVRAAPGGPRRHLHAAPRLAHDHAHARVGPSDRASRARACRSP